jgi:hypothetical protein
VRCTIGTEQARTRALRGREVPDEIVDLGSALEGAAAELGSESTEQAASDATQTQETTEPTRFTVKVRGQEQEVELDELLNGYQRQADYTRGTQELAAERQRLEAAQALWEDLHASPRDVIEALQEHFAEQLGAEPPSAEEQRLAALEADVEERRQREIEDQVASEIRTLQESYEDEFDGDELLEYAIEHRIGNLEAAYLHRARANERAAKEQERATAKRTAPPVAGGSRAAEAHEEPEPPVTSLRDALKAALKEHGASSLT